MPTVGFSIRIETSMRRKLEELASANYRTLNGEINKALDFYIKYGSSEVTMVHTEPVTSIDEPIKPETDEFVLNTNNFGEEVDEF